MFGRALFGFAEGNTLGKVKTVCDYLCNLIYFPISLVWPKTSKFFLLAPAFVVGSDRPAEKYERKTRHKKKTKGILIWV